MIKWILLILIVIIVVIFFILRPLFKEPDFHKTSGDYKVGTHLFETVDSGRSKPFLLEIQEREDFKDMQI